MYADPSGKYPERNGGKKIMAGGIHTQPEVGRHLYGYPAQRPMPFMNGMSAVRGFARDEF